MSARAYEILFIVLPQFSEEQRKAITDRIEKTLTSNEGEILEFKEVGLKKFAMEMKKQTEGYYYQIRFKGTGTTMITLKEHLKVSEDIFRHLVVTLDSVLSKAELEAVVNA